jgi:hypothetical protein
MIKSDEYLNDILMCGTNSRGGLLALLAPSHFHAGSREPTA